VGSYKFEQKIKLLMFFWQLGTCKRMRHQSSLIAVLWFGANVLPRQPSVGHRVGGLQRITY
jgi:hypothetical protein